MTLDPNSHQPGLDRQARGHASLTLWLLNVLLGVLVGTAYLGHLPDELSPRAWVFVVCGLFSSIAILALVPAMVSWLSVRFLRSANAQAWIQGLVGATFLSVIKTDTVVYELLRYHFLSSAVLNVATTSGSEDAVHLGGHVWLPIIIAISLIATAQFFLWRHLYRRHFVVKTLRESPSLLARPVALWAIVLVVVVSIEKSIYAAADIDGDREVQIASEVLPAYSQLRVTEFLPEGLGLNTQEVTNISLFDKATPLAYPHSWPKLEEAGARPNILILVIDSWRQDSFNQEVTPELHELAQSGLRFQNHNAGGNGTRFGIFSMLYGMHGSYWFSALEEQRSPVLLDVLQDTGYEVQVCSSASMNFPEFRECAWVNCLEGVYDDFPSEEPYERDLLAAQRFGSFLQERSKLRDVGGQTQPFFSFVLLDAAHQPYSSPGEGPFSPAAERYDYLELSHDRSPALIERHTNRYRNSLYFTDGVAASLLQELHDSGEYENTLIIVTGDHGEEFQENGFWGHTSNFTPEQVSVPFFMLGYGIEPGIEVRPTSHQDIAPTILEQLGADPAMRSEWCLGESLFAPLAERNMIVSGWEHVGVITPEFIFRMRIGGRGAKDVSVYNQNWQPQNDANEQIKLHESSLQRMSEECRRFLVPLGTN
ncbi:MAG: membrane-anchored protein YejM (alkaline phosphatase superfamily) [Planctomycetota bacterium]|jgi:membrane-anchored protein YejM (alkaline phosphatase superfamily)